MRNTRFISTLASNGSSTASGPGGCFLPCCDIWADLIIDLGNRAALQDIAGLHRYCYINHAQC